MAQRRPYNVLDGMGEAILALARQHCTPQQWAAWLKVPLQGAAAEGDLTTVETLLKAGAACSGERERDGLTPLHAAAEGGSLEIVSTLLKGKAKRDVNKLTRGARQSPLYCAVKGGHGEVALALLRAGADVNSTNTIGWSALMRATADGRADLVNNLLLSGALANAKTKEGSRPLHCAVEKGHVEVIKVLLKAGASTCYRRRCDGKSALDLAVERGDTAALRELLAAGALTEGAPFGISNLGAVMAVLLKGVNDDGMSALHIAALQGHSEAIDVLIDAGASPDCRGDDDDTPLHTACSFAQPDSVRALLRREADENLVNDDFETPLEVTGNGVSEDERDEDVVEWIMEMLARAPADRVWRRRGWLAILNARRKSMLEADHLSYVWNNRDDRGELGGDEHRAMTVFAAEESAKRHRTMRMDEWGRNADLNGDNVVHPSLKKFHATVTKLVDVTDELVFRRIVSFL